MLLDGTAPAVAAAGALVGIEHEYRVLDLLGRQVDFRTLLHTLPVDGERLDPGFADIVGNGFADGVGVVDQIVPDAENMAHPLF